MKRLELLDYGRMGAALAVMAFHYLFNGISNGKIDSITAEPALVELVKYGYLGVEFFFLISGYVIFFSAQSRSAGLLRLARDEAHPRVRAGSVPHCCHRPDLGR